MTREDAEYVRGKCRVIAVNNQGIDTVHSETKELVPAFAPWADVLYAADTKWWQDYAPRSLAFAGLKVTIRDAYGMTGVNTLRISTEQVFDPKPTHLVTGGNSGYQAVHLAAHFGAKRILLLGFDMKMNGKQRHWFGNHPGRLNSPGNYPQWVRSFGRLATALKGKGIQVINCSTTSALDCFLKAPLRDSI
jgi:hypothetical protein